MRMLFAMPRTRHTFLILVFACGASGLFVSWLRLETRTPTALGPHEGRLAACPDRPNCVSSFATDPQHAIEPLRFTGRGADAMRRLRTLLVNDFLATLITDEEAYLHVEYRTRWLRFVDDVEFLLDEPSHAIHVRSASRVGYSDLGKNRARLERLRVQFDEGN